MNVPPEPGDRRPGTPRPPLERPPGERYGPSTGANDVRPIARTTNRAVALGALVAIGGAVLIVLLGGVLALSAGLLVVAGVIGWLIGAVVTANADPAGTRGLRRLVAAFLALDSLVLGQVGLWLFARAQGGTLELIDYLVQTRGLLVPLEVLVAVVVAWWTTR